MKTDEQKEEIRNVVHGFRQKMIIEVKAIWRGRTGGEKCYFHPRATLVNDRKLMMTLQEITASDYFHPVQYAFSNDLGNSWTEPELIPGFGRSDIGNGIQEGVCDVVPDFHHQTQKVIVTGHNVYYKDDRLYDSLGDFHQEKNTRKLQRFPVYNVRNEKGEWLPKRKKIQCDEFSGCSIFSCGCSQKVFLPDGNLIIPVTFGFFRRKDRMVSSLLCNFDGNEITVLKKGRTLELAEGRGLLEPSAVFCKNRYFMTIRAEDNHGYLAVSDDGLDWTHLKQWQFDDSTEITMSTTQQHWLEHGGKLYLVYNRKADKNLNVIRWRSPLFIAEFDIENECLIRKTEQLVFPMVGDGVNDPDNVPVMGNFHPLKISDEKGIVTVGETLPRAGWKGNTLIAHIS